MLGIVGVGCGGGSDGTNSSATKAEFVKQADLICADAKSERLAAAEEEFNPKQRQGGHVVGSAAVKALEAELAELGEEVLQEKMIPSMKSQLKQLEGLDAPAADEAKIQKMLDNMNKAIGEVEKQGFKGLIGGNQFDPFDAEAQSYGLNCKVV